MTATHLIFPALAAITLFLLIMMGVQKVLGAKGSTNQRLRRITGAQNTTSAIQSGVFGGQTRSEKNAPNPDTLLQEQEMSSLGITLEQILKLIGINTETFRKSSQMLFYRAGIQSPDGPIFYLFFKRIGFIFFLLLALFVTMNAGVGMGRVMHLMLAFILVILALFGADLFLSNKRSKREKTLQHSFPDALDLLLVCVESGLALDGAFARVCKELGRAYPEITQEFNRTRLELTVLNDRTTALENLADRTNMNAFRSLVTTLIQSERFGTSLTDTLRVLSEDFRHKRLMVAEEKAGRMPVLMTLPLIIFLLPALLMIVLGPAIVGMLTGK